MPTNNENYGLALVDLKANRVVAERQLAGSDRTQLPAIAASGQHLAVAAMRDRGIRVYAVADLLNGQQAAPAGLRVPDWHCGRSSSWKRDWASGLAKKPAPRI